MLERFRQFFARETRLTQLFLLFLGLLVILIVFFQVRGREPTESETLQEFRHAEEAWHERMTQKGALEDFMVKHPREALLFNVFSMIGILGLGIGLIIDFNFAFKAPFRHSISRTGPPIAISWSLLMLAKVVLIWALLALLFSMGFALVRTLWLPDLNLNSAALVHTTAMDLVSVILILQAIKEKKGNWRDIGFWVSKKETLSEAGYGLVGYLAILPLFIGILMVLVFIAELFHYEPPAHPLVEIFLEEEKRAPVLVLYSLFLAGIVGPIVEEIFFRGFFYPILKQKWGIAWAMVITSSAFAFIHQNQFAFWPIFLLGMALAYLYEKRRNIIAPITLHVVHNSLFLAYFFLAKQIILNSGSTP